MQRSFYHSSFSFTKIILYSCEQFIIFFQFECCGVHGVSDFNQTHLITCSHYPRACCPNLPLDETCNDTRKDETVKGCSVSVHLNVEESTPFVKITGVAISALVTLVRGFCSRFYFIICTIIAFVTHVNSHVTVIYCRMS